MDIPVPHSPLDLEAMDDYFASRSYAIGYTFSNADVALLKEFSISDSSHSSNLVNYPHISRWSRHIRALRKTDPAQDVQLPAEILSIFQQRGKVGALATTILILIHVSC